MRGDFFCQCIPKIFKLARTPVPFIAPARFSQKSLRLHSSLQAYLQQSARMLYRKRNPLDQLMVSANTIFSQILE